MASVLSLICILNPSTRGGTRYPILCPSGSFPPCAWVCAGQLCQIVANAAQSANFRKPHSTARTCERQHLHNMRVLLQVSEMKRQTFTGAGFPFAWACFAGFPTLLARLSSSRPTKKGCALARKPQTEGLSADAIIAFVLLVLVYSMRQVMYRRRDAKWYSILHSLVNCNAPWQHERGWCDEHGLLGGHIMPSTFNSCQLRFGEV